MFKIEIFVCFFERYNINISIVILTMTVHQEQVISTTIRGQRNEMYSMIKPATTRGGFFVFVRKDIRIIAAIFDPFRQINPLSP